ncbi:MAG: 60S ribosomal protein L35 [Trizodia sp. TS-e1964]|nr:MAG: 60S ribosomal protein L35 [Trizodia sp. TS-e1964]
MQSSKVKVGAAWGKGKEELLKQIGEFKTELSQLRVQKIAGGATSKLNKIHDIRKSIAKVMTVIKAKQRGQLRNFYKGKKYLPLDLRPKQTRAQRRALTKEEKAIVLPKVAKRLKAFPPRKFAVRAV